MNVVTNLTTLKAIGRKYHLIFCREHRYCETGPYKNEIGESIPAYLWFRSHGDHYFTLEYVDGCFNPYLVKHKLTFDEKGDRIRKIINHQEGKDLLFVP